MDTLTRMMELASAPSKRSNKHRSGRSGRKQYSASRELQKVKGFVRHMDAIFAPADQELCHIVDHRVGYTTSGDLNRSPQHHDIINGTSAPQRGM